MRAVCVLALLFTTSKRIILVLATEQSQEQTSTKLRQTNRKKGNDWASKVRDALGAHGDQTAEELKAILSAPPYSCGWQKNSVTGVKISKAGVYSLVKKKK